MIHSINWICCEELWLTGPKPLGVARGARRTVIQQLLDFFHRQVRHKVHNHEESCKKPAFGITPRALKERAARERFYQSEIIGELAWHHSAQERLCNSVVLGRIWESLHRHGKTVPEEASDELGSADSLIQTLRRAFGTFDTLGLGDLGLHGHEECGLVDRFHSFQLELVCEWMDYRNVLEGKHLDQLVERGEQLGTSHLWSPDGFGGLEFVGHWGY